MVTKVLTNYARVLMFLEDLVSLPEDCGKNSVCNCQMSGNESLFANRFALQVHCLRDPVPHGSRWRNDVLLQQSGQGAEHRASQHANAQLIQPVVQLLLRARHYHDVVRSHVPCHVLSHVRAEEEVLCQEG